MSKKILIAYGSRYGSTEEISIHFKQILEEKGFIVDIFNLKSKKKQLSKINSYSGVLIGSGISIGRWTKDAKKFLKNNVVEIHENKILVGIYLSSGLASNPEKRPEAIEKYLIKIFEKLGLELGDHIQYDAFGGVYDLSENTNLSGFYQKMLKMGAKEDPDNIVVGERKDNRDWDQIDSFINSFISKIH
ncbi:MAG: hypothetical protein KGD63_07510 [Candidatus Lokiarchaeota archaeon]|nr:hypothetical protein [Candidatus Lokiarchaeota archaeon]